MCAEQTQRSRNNRNTTIFAYVLLPTDVNSYAVELAMRTHGQQFQSDCLFIGHVLVYGNVECMVELQLPLVVLCVLCRLVCAQFAFSSMQLHCIWRAVNAFTLFNCA